MTRPPRLQTACVVAMFTSILVAGCLGAEEPAGAEQVILVQGSEVRCSDSVTDCPTAPTDGGPVLLRGLDLRADGIAHTAIVLDDLTTSVEVQGVTATGFPQGILLRGTICSTCTVIVANTTFDVGLQGVVASAPDAKLTLENVTLHTGGGGIVRTTVEGGGTKVEYLGGSNGIFARAPLHLEVRDLRITAAEPSAGTGLDLGAGVAGSLQAVTIQGYARGLVADANDLGLEGVRIDCRSMGLVVRGTILVANGLDVRGCSSIAVDAPFATRVDLRAVHLEGNGIGVRLAQGRDFDLHEFVLADNDYGVLLLGDNLDRVSGDITRGVVRNHTYVGIQAKWANLNVTGVAFIQNGHGGVDPAGPSEAWYYGGLVHRGPVTGGTVAVVTESTFEGNTPYALSNVGSDPLLAPNNWWGDARGPTVAPTPLAPVTTQGGPEQVFGVVETAPHQTQP